MKTKGIGVMSTETEREAFEAWCKTHAIKEDSSFVVMLWQAACAYQRSADADICDDLSANGSICLLNEAAHAIRSQNE